MKFDSLEKAQAAYDAQGLELKNVQGELATAKAGLKTAEKAAEDAIALANAKPEDPDKVFVKVGSDKYEVVFGVDGLTKEELAKDSKKVAAMVKKGTAALVKVED